MHQTLTNIVFSSNFTNLIMSCVTSVSFSVIINGYPTNSIISTRGIRQEDHISPYLFILCANVFSSLIRIFFFPRVCVRRWKVWSLGSSGEKTRSIGLNGKNSTNLSWVKD